MGGGGKLFPVWKYWEWFKVWQDLCGIGKSVSDSGIVIAVAAHHSFDDDHNDNNYDSSLD